MWYTYEFRNADGKLVEDHSGSTGSIQPDKMKDYIIRQKEQNLTAKHGVKCFVKLTKTER